MVDDPPQQLVQAPLLPRTTTHPLSPQDLDLDLDHYQHWARLDQNYQLQAAMDAAASSHYTDSLPVELAIPPHQTIASRRLPGERTTLRFPSTLPAPPHRHSPQTLAHPPRPSLASDLSQQDPTTMMARVSEEEQEQEQMLAAHLAAAAAEAVGAARSTSTSAGASTGASLAPSLDDSPSWSSAMTQMQMEQFDRLYHYQAAQAQQAQQAQQEAQQAAQAAHSHSQRQLPSRGPPPHPGSSRAPRSSHSSIGPAPLPPSLPAAPAHHHQYASALRRQQQEQLRMQQARLRAAQAQVQAAFEEKERARRSGGEEEGEEEAYFRQLAEAYGGASPSPHLHPHPHPHPHLHPHLHHMQEHGGHPYFPVGLPAGYPDGALAGAHRADGGEGYPHPGAMLEQDYRLVDGAPPGPLDLVGVPGVVAVAAAAGSPTAGMIKFESPLPLE
ncbi:hypothetical protein AcV7_009502 [Taiwanofungus camphoratus]|nr:hypothetical protein AcV7_009502 [Antrodia cinnamomea]